MNSSAKPHLFRHGKGWACVAANTDMGYGRNARGAYNAWAALKRGRP